MCPGWRGDGWKHLGLQAGGRQTQRQDWRCLQGDHVTCIATKCGRFARVKVTRARVKVTRARVKVTRARVTPYEVQGHLT